MKLGKFVSLVILCIFNGIATILGILMLVFAIMHFATDPEITKSVKTNSIRPFFDVIVGILTLAITTLGWYSVSKRHKLSLLIYTIIILSMAIIEFIVCLALFAAISRMGDDEVPALVDNLKEKYSKYSNDTDVRAELDDIHKTYKCCGPEKAIKIDKDYPTSCCKTLDNNKCVSPYERGCARRIVSTINIRVTDGLILTICGAAFKLVAGSCGVILYHSRMHPHE